MGASAACASFLLNRSTLSNEAALYAVKGSGRVRGQRGIRAAGMNAASDTGRFAGKRLGKRSRGQKRQGRDQCR